MLTPPVRSRLTDGVLADADIIRPQKAVLDAVTVRTWIRPGGFGVMALALITPPVTEAQTPPVTEADMRALARALRLAPARSRVPESGPRVVLQRIPGTRYAARPRSRAGRVLPPLAAWLRLDGSPLQLLLPAADPWTAMVRADQAVCLVVGLDPLAAAADRERYLARLLPRGRALMGLAHQDTR